MPELPEVETVVRSLNKTVLGRKIKDVWSDSKKLIKKPKDFALFKKELVGRVIKIARRRGKNILIELSGSRILLIHLKMTGHLLYGTWKMLDTKWKPTEKGPLQDSVNRFIHLLFWLDNKKMLALSDLRKFAKAELWEKSELEKDGEIKKLGPEPLERSFTASAFAKALADKQGKIKQVLMNQEIIAGIGNIYSDEILWEARIHPLAQVQKLSRFGLDNIYRAMKKVLVKAIRLQGDSMSDYRLLTGEKGRYQEVQKVYRQEGKPCPRKDDGIIQRAKIGGRSAHFCPVCQKINE